MGIDKNYKHSELTGTIIGVFYDVYNELGFGFLGINQFISSKVC